MTTFSPSPDPLPSTFLRLRPTDPITEPAQPFRRVDCPAEADRLHELGLVRYVVADVLVAFDAPDSQEERAVAAALLIPAELRTQNGWVVGFASAAWLLTGSGLGSAGPTGSAGPAPELQVIVPPGRRRPKAAGVRGRQVALAPDQVIFLGPVPVTDPVRTAADVARDLPAADAVPVLRRLGELCGVRPHDVLQVLAAMRYARGAATARQVVKAWTAG